MQFTTCFVRKYDESHLVERANRGDLFLTAIIYRTISPEEVFDIRHQSNRMLKTFVDLQNQAGTSGQIGVPDLQYTSTTVSSKRLSGTKPSTFGKDLAGKLGFLFFRDGAKPGAQQPKLREDLSDLIAQDTGAATSLVLWISQDLFLVFTSLTGSSLKHWTLYAVERQASRRRLLRCAKSSTTIPCC